MPPSKPKPLVVFVLLVVLNVLLGGCAEKLPRNALPPELLDRSEISGIENARVWSSGWPEFSMDFFATATDAQIREVYSGVYDTSHNYLAISGGGADGAFGAGLLAGWTAKGARPEFTVVTGISTGALSAPFAFLGSSHDNTLKKLYTTTQTDEIIKKRNIFESVFTDSVVDTAPLQALISRYITTDIVEAIAREHLRGRRLFMGTFNLDAGRSVIWNIGAIAASDYEHKQSLIHDIMRASAAIPVAFPPVLIKVELDGVTYDEMHVDGGTGAQVFVYPAAVNWDLRMERLRVEEQPRVYVIRNGRITPEYEPVDRKIIPIATRSVSSLIRTQGVGDLYQIFSLCKRDGNDFNLAFIPEEFNEPSSELFDTSYMTKLYQFAYDLAVKDDLWKKTPPGFELK